MNLPSCEAAFDAEIRTTKVRRNFMMMMIVKVEFFMMGR
jgi:hypothetical protein